MTAAMAHVSSESIHEAFTGLSSNGVLVRDAFPRRNPTGARDKRPIKGTTLRFEQLSPAGHILGTDPAAPQLLLEPAPAGRPSAPATRQERPRVLGVVHQPHAPQALQDFLDGPRREALLS